MRSEQAVIHYRALDVDCARARAGLLVYVPACGVPGRRFVLTPRADQVTCERCKVWLRDCASDV